MVVGLRNDKLSEKLQMNSGLTLEQQVFNKPDKVKMLENNKE